MQDVLGFGYKHAGNLVPVDGHRQDGLGFKNRLVAVMGDLDAAGLTTMTNLDLRLDYAGEFWAKMASGVGMSCSSSS